MKSYRAKLPLCRHNIHALVPRHEREIDHNLEIAVAGTPAITLSPIEYAGIIRHSEMQPADAHYHVRITIAANQPRLLIKGRKTPTAGVRGC